jgi:hypothetical protein
MHMKDPEVPILNRTHDLPASSAMSQPTALTRTAYQSMSRRRQTFYALNLPRLVRGNPKCTSVFYEKQNQLLVDLPTHFYAKKASKWKLHMQHKVSGTTWVLVKKSFGM